MAVNPADRLNTQEFLNALREDPKFQAVMAEVNRLRPIVPVYLPKGTKEETDVIVEQIKFTYGEQRGFDLLFNLLTGFSPR